MTACPPPDWTPSARQLAGMAAEGRLKSLITSDIQMIESKGIDPIRLKNYVRVLMTSNEHWVVPAGRDERRFCVLDVNPRCAQNHDYFREMDEELANGGREALLHDLLAFDLSTLNLRQIPRTEALLQQKVQSLDSVDSWWLARLSAGAPLRDGDGWPGEVQCDALFRDYLAAADEIGIKRKSDQNTFGVRLNELVPNLTKRRPRIPLDIGGVARPRFYVLPALRACRERFVEIVQQPIKWDEEEDCGENS